MTADTIVRVDPKTLLIGANVRKNTKLSETFVKTITELGVLTPIVAVQTEAGLEVIDGQRRTLAAQHAGLVDVPVFVTGEMTAAERIVDQVVVNGQREELDEEEGIVAVQELALFDIPVSAIVERTGLPESFVHRAVKVGGSAAAKKAIAEHQLSFDGAVIIAEFEEFPEEQKQLLAIADGGQFWQVREKSDLFRKQRAERAVLAEIESLGIVAIKQPDEYYSDDPRPIRRLYVDKAMKKRLSDEPHEKVVELAGDGLRAYPTQDWVDGKREHVIGYAVAGWRDRGLFGEASGGGSSKPSTPEEAEKLKAERRAARESTKAWLEASVPRIEFLQGLVARKTMPKGWEPVVAARMLDSAGSFSTSQLKMIQTILKLDDSASDLYSLRGAIQKALAADPTRAPHVMLAIEFGCVEGGGEYDRKGWGGTWQVSAEHSAAHLSRLVGWGFKLSEIEQSVVDAAKKGKKAA